MVIYGGVGIVSTFLQLGLIDEYRIWVSPVVLGSGKPLFKGLHDQLNLKLLETKVFGSGVVLLYYQPDRKEPK
jgi:dihydrofolate reductase